MRHRKIIVLGFAGLLLLAGALVVLYAPQITKWYILDSYDYIQSIDRVELKWTHAELYGLNIKKKNIEANLSCVKINLKKEIEIIGGKVIIREQKSTNEPSKIKIKASELDVSVHIDNVLINTKNTSYNKGKVCFSSGTLKYKISGSFGKGCVQQKRGYLSNAETTIVIPKKIPHVNALLLKSRSFLVKNRRIRPDSPGKKLLAFSR